MKKAPGILPCQGWLIENGYAGLWHAMRRHPEAFAHIQQDRKRFSPGEFVPQAETMAKEHNGILPNPAWLIANGHANLYATMRAHPSLFAHIPQESKKGRTPEAWVPIAEQLAKKNGGRLPSPLWLAKNGYSSLPYAIRKRPALFAHIPQESKKGRTAQEWLWEAEKLAKRRGGVLPHDAWLMKNGYSGLPRAVQAVPDLFAHIPQESKRRTHQQWMREAQALASKHGKLPNCQWLITHGYSGLYATMKKHPGLFTCIPQMPKEGRSPREWVSVAETLAKTNGGKLPHTNWLYHNGFSGLTRVMREQPQLLAHIPSEEKRHRSSQEWVSAAEKLAAEHSGMLPNTNWLQKNGYSGLDHAKRKNPRLFAHIAQVPRYSQQPLMP